MNRGLPSRRSRRIAFAAVVLFFGAVLACACLIPWNYPSQTILYKFGADRTTLLMGKMAGVCALFLLGLQPILGGRFRCLDRYFSLNRMLWAHRACGVLITALAVAHPLLVYWSEEVRAMTPAWELWPEVLGGAALLMLVFLAVAAIWRAPMLVEYHWWRLAHILAAPVLLLGAGVHALFVSDAFAQGAPRVSVFIAVGLGLAVWMWGAVSGVRRANPHVVEKIEEAAVDARAIELSPKGAPLNHLAGQFAFVRVRSQTLSSEAHPFTISSPPGAEQVRFTIRCCGDWTRRAGALQVGDEVFVEGPYGLFCLEAVEAERLIFIAGGVGVTPMLSMLGRMAQAGDARPVVLVWSNRTPEQAVHFSEVEALQKRLKNLQLYNVMTRIGETDGKSQRVDRAFLQRVCGEYRPGTAAFVCGPPNMMKDTARALRALGFAKRNIMMEEFSF